MLQSPSRFLHDPLHPSARQGKDVAGLLPRIRIAEVEKPTSHIWGDELIKGPLRSKDIQEHEERTAVALSGSEIKGKGRTPPPPPPGQIII